MTVGGVVEATADARPVRITGRGCALEIETRRARDAGALRRTLQKRDAMVRVLRHAGLRLHVRVGTWLVLRVTPAGWRPVRILGLGASLRAFPAL